MASFAVVLLSRRITPLWSNNALVTLTAIGMVGGSALCVVSCFWLQVAALKYAGSCWRERGWDCSSSCGPNSSDR